MTSASRSLSLILVLSAFGFSAACQAHSKTDGTPATPPASPTGTALAAPSVEPAKSGGALTIAYSDWPGWIAWDIATERGFFRDAGVNVKLEWFEYVPSMEAFSEGKVDAVCMTNGDALVSASGGAQGVGILINDYSNGNDMIVARPGIDSIADLKGKVGVEVGFVDHLLLMEALKSAHLTESDVDIVNERTQKTPELLRSGAVAAVAAWQPNSGEALSLVPGSRAIFTSANAPGLIYDLLFVSPTSLKERRPDWMKVVSVWFRVAGYIQDPKTRADAIRIMKAPIEPTPRKVQPIIGSPFIFSTPRAIASISRRAQRSSPSSGRPMRSTSSTWPIIPTRSLRPTNPCSIQP